MAYKIKEKHSKKIFIDQLIVTNESRRKGMGKLLMSYVEEIAIKENCDRIELDCWIFNEKQRITGEKKPK